MANFVLLQAIYTKIVESIQARRIRVDLSIAYQKLEEKKSRKRMEIGACKKFGRAAKFSQSTKFRRLRIFLPTTTVHHAALFMSLALFTILLFDVLTHFCHFLVFFLFYPHCNSICYVILVIFKGGLAIKAPKISTIDISFMNKNLFLAGSFQLSYLFFFCFIFSPFLPLSRLPNTALRMTT